MSASRLYDSVARIARHEAAARPVASVGEVTSIFPSDGGPPDHAVSVKLRESGLLLERVPVAVGALGFAAIPALGELVLVLFVHADFHAPVIVGRLYHPDQNPPEHADGSLVLRLPSGAEEPELECEIKGSPASIALTLPGQVSVDLLEEKLAFAVGELRVVLDGAGGGRLEISAGGSKITLRKDGDISIHAAGKLTLEGNEVEISGQAKVKVTGATVELN